MDDRPAWFAPKSYGYGTGFPISWQGWLLFIGYLLVLLVGGLTLTPRSELAYLAIVIPLTVAFTWIAKRTTRGGWRWRWGGDE